jgi:hypothetical protein
VVRGAPVMEEVGVGAGQGLADVGDPGRDAG